jgi:hypothetical protein
VCCANQAANFSITSFGSSNATCCSREKPLTARASGSIYLAVVSFIPNAADPGDLMRNGSPQWILVVFGIIAFPFGLFLWNRLGVHFGLGEARGKVNGRVTMAVFALLIVLVLIEAVTYGG